LSLELFSSLINFLVIGTKEINIIFVFLSSGSGSSSGSRPNKMTRLGHLFAFLPYLLT
jgi:hypothetical protein